MTYIYDILLNWTDEKPYEFYEWQINDMLEQIKKIPVIKVEKDTFCHLKNSNIIIPYSILQKINKKTITESSRISTYLDYVSLFTDGLDVIAVEFNKKGKSLMKSSLLLDEMEEILEISKRLEIIPFDCKVVKTNNKDEFSTRLEKEYKRLVIKELNSINSNKNIDKLKYLYYEWFNEISNDFNHMYNKLKNIFNNEWTKKHIELYNLIKLSYIKK
ncbi:MAG: DUF3603 family protein [Bacilli bacterium]